MKGRPRRQYKKSVRDKCRIRIAVFVFSSGTLSGYLGLSKSTSMFASFEKKM